MKSILAINGSAASRSANGQLIKFLAARAGEGFRFTFLADLKTFPHFDPDLSADDPPPEIMQLRNSIREADGLLISTPEYIFSIPSGLKNVIEWCIASTVLSGKPCGLITAAAGGQKAHEELQLLMSTAMALFTPDTVLLISGVKGKLAAGGHVTDAGTLEALDRFYTAFRELVVQPGNAKPPGQDGR